MNLEVKPDDIEHDASAFDHLADSIAAVFARLGAPALTTNALDGAELRPAETAFEDLWRRCEKDASALADSLRRLAATVRTAGAVYRSTDAHAAATFEAHEHGMQSP